MSDDVIVAPATPPGRSALAVVRLSGRRALEVARLLCPGPPEWRPRRATLRRVLDGDRLVDEVVATWAPGPRTYTGEDTVELSCHGNPLVVEAVVALAVRAGARPARPGEFTRRAVENGRMDLLRAEAVAALVEARGPAGLRVAQRALAGAVGDLVGALEEEVAELAAEVEARADFPDQALDLRDDAELARALEALAGRAERAVRGWRASRARLRGARVALVGPVNAGKSSLFNRLVGEERALVSDEPGTTRDAVERAVLVDGVEIAFLDTAGERAGARGLEAAGLDLGRRLAGDADLALVVLPLHREVGPEAAAVLARWPPGRRLVVGTHLDRLADPDAHPAWPPDLPAPDHRVSSVDGRGVDALRAAVARAVAGETGEALLTSARQQELLAAVARHLRAAAGALRGPLGPAVAAVEATRALGRLAELRGADPAEEVLDRLFARFCIGK